MRTVVKKGVQEITIKDATRRTYPHLLFLCKFKRQYGMYLPISNRQGNSWGLHTVGYNKFLTHDKGDGNGDKFVEASTLSGLMDDWLSGPTAHQNSILQFDDVEELFYTMAEIEREGSVWSC